MFRVKQCCCCCTLRTGTLILLWLDLVYAAMSMMSVVLSFFSQQKNNTMNTLMCLYLAVRLVITIYGLVAVNNKRPSYLLPYIALCVLGLVFGVIILILVWTGAVWFKEYLNKYMEQSMSQQQQRSHFDDDYNGERKTITKDAVNKIYNDFFSLIIMILTISFALSVYFTSVVYSYYKELQEEVRTGCRGGGVIYAAPLEQQPNAPAKQPYDNYPPSYGQQPAAAYPSQPAYAPHNVAYPQLPGQKQ